MTHARIYTLEHRHVVAVLSGAARITNYPADRDLMAYQTGDHGRGLNIYVHSMTFSGIRRGQQIPTVPAQVEYL